MAQAHVHPDGEIQPSSNSPPDGDVLLFASEDATAVPQPRAGARWRVLMADDEAEVHSVTRLVLDDFVFEGRGVELLSAYSGRECIDILREQGDIAVVLLDVVMETHDAGLEVARRVREELGNRLTRIVLRTGQPGQAPEFRVITSLDINDYRQKTELTAQRLFTTITAALRSYRDLRTIEESRMRLINLAGSVAHQVRNRTMTIGGFASILCRKLPEHDPLREPASTILEEAKRLERMVARVSDFAALAATQHCRVDVSQALRSAMDATREHMRRHGLAAQWHISVQPLFVHAPQPMLERLLRELLCNGVDFARVEHGEVWLAITVEGALCRIEVRDNGAGISEADRPFIFDPFFSRKADGVGMGLSIVRRITCECNWLLEVERAPEGGALFAVSLPLCLGSGVEC